MSRNQDLNVGVKNVLVEKRLCWCFTEMLSSLKVLKRSQTESSNSANPVRR